MAADLTLAGFEVNLFELPEFRQNIKPCLERGGIEITGVARVGFAKPAVMTSDIGKAMDDVDIVMVTVPAFAHETFVSTFAPHLNDKQIVVFNTGYFAALRFRKTLRSRAKRVLICENSVLPYTCRLVGPGHVHVDGKKKQTYVAALPATGTEHAVDILRAAYPGVKCAANVLKTSLDNFNILAHAAGTLLHKGLVERADSVELPVKEAVTPSVARVMEAINGEVSEVGKAFGVKVSSVKEMLEMWGWATKGETVYDLYQNCEALRNYTWKWTRGSHQYLKEDLSYGLVPLASFGELGRVPTPTIDAIIKLFSIFDGVDYRTEGVTCEKMGLAALTSDSLQRLLNDETQ